MRQIATKLIDGQDCDTTLKIVSLAIIAKDTTIASQARTITKQDTIQKATEKLLTIVTKERDDTQKVIKKKDRALKWTKLGWVATTVVSVFIIVLALL